MLAEYSNAMNAGDTRAIYEFWSPDFVSHVTDRMAPDRVGTDVRDGEHEWWGTTFYDVEPTREPVEINGTGILRIRDGKIVEHWGGPHCQSGLGYIQ